MVFDQKCQKTFKNKCFSHIENRPLREAHRPLKWTSQNRPSFEFLKAMPPQNHQNGHGMHPFHLKIAPFDAQSNSTGPMDHWENLSKFQNFRPPDRPPGPSPGPGQPSEGPSELPKKPRIRPMARKKICGGLKFDMST